MEIGPSFEDTLEFIRKCLEIQRHKKVWYGEHVLGQKIRINPGRQTGKTTSIIELLKTAPFKFETGAMVFHSANNRDQFIKTARNHLSEELILRNMFFTPADIHKFRGQRSPDFVFIDEPDLIPDVVMETLGPAMGDTKNFIEFG